MAAATVVLKNGILAFAGVAAFAALIGCSTLPRPASFDSSLLVIETGAESSSGPHAVSDRVVLSGPVPIRLNLAGGQERVLFFRVKPGRYVLDSRTIRFANGRRRAFTHPEGTTIDVPPATIILAHWKLSDPGTLAGSGDRGRVVVPTTPADRRLAAQKLADYVRLARWAGRRITGFAPYSPFTDYLSKKFTVRIESTPAGSQTIIDGQNWGNTPLPVSLTPGRHMVLLEHAGYLQHRAFIDVENDGTESFVLDPAPASGGASGKSVVLVEPFGELGKKADSALGTLLTKSLRVALRQDGVAVLEEGPEKPASQAAGPDFSAAERSGAPVFVAGDYTTDGRTVILHAALYDTRSRLVKTSVVESGDTGLGLFESIDRMSSALAAAVEKKLPEVGHRVVQERVMTPQSVSFDAQVNEQDIIRKRNKKRTTFSIGPALVGVFDNVADPTGVNSSTGRINGPGLGIYGSAGLPLSGPLTLNVATLPFFYRDANKAPKVEIPLYVGARWNFYGYMSDVYLGLQGAAHFAPATAINFSSGSPTPSSPVTVGPFWLFGLNFETGVRIYTYQRISSLPTYFGFGLTLGLFGYRFKLNFTNPTAYPMEIGLRLYWGTRL